jgi:branched-chain amino acid transport system ATP-binding protein
MSLLTVESLNGGYTKAPVLRGVSIEVGAGESVGILGANGAGKTTLLRALSGVLPVCSGRITLDGRTLHRLSPWARVKTGLAHVPEGRHVFTAMTVRENLEVAALVRSRSRRSLDEVWTLFPRLRERQNQQAGSLSGGEQQMLAISRALMTGPQVLMIDEMSAGLAPVLAQQMVEGLMDIRKTGVGVLLIEQSPQVIADSVDRMYLLENGCIVGHGSLQELGGADALAALYLGVA